MGDLDTFRFRIRRTGGDTRHKVWANSEKEPKDWTPGEPPDPEECRRIIAERIGA